MIRLCRVLLLVLLASPVFVLAQDKKEDNTGWVNLLEGSDLAKHWTTKGNWKLADGVVTLTPREGEKGWSRFDAYLWAKNEYKDFEIEFEYQVQKGG
ncbi:MAG: DUF1080 domain-containing protein, partial [Planctomycetia bacterium]|nr:DUF1080 domain-containing protein [Planctomycetia bacterium]